MAKRKSVAAAWAREVQKAMAVEVQPTMQTRPEIEADIADITRWLIGPLPSVERLDLVEARSMKRKQLAMMTGKETTP